MRLRDEGITVLGIERSDSSYVGAPHGDTSVCTGDTLIVYGRKTTLLELNERREGRQGEQAHGNAVTTHQQIRSQQDRQDKSSIKNND